MDSPIVRVDYNCQGYSVNDPTITVDVIGQKGEIVNMTYSRYDQAFLGVITDTSRRISESAPGGSCRRSGTCYGGVGAEEGDDAVASTFHFGPCLTYATST